jgi:hypothetical protein
MEIIKVMSTQTIKDSQKGDINVVKGKLVLIKQYWKNTHGIITTGYHFKPIIISETEKIEAGDKVLTSYSRVLRITHVFDRGYNVTEEDWYKENPNKGEYWLANKDVIGKILALPEHFSPKHLQAIVDGKMKDGDEVYVECEKHGNCKVCNNQGVYHCAHPEECGNAIEFTQIKLNLNNHITLHKIEKKTYTRDEVLEIVRQRSLNLITDMDKYLRLHPMSSSENWFNRNYPE